MKNEKLKIKDKIITVVGLGKSGFAAAKFLAEKGAKVFATECSQNKTALENAARLKQLGVEVETGGHSADFVEESALVVTSPGVSKKSLPLSLAKKNKIPVISEIELAFYFCKAPILAITGSNGKTTASCLLYKMLEKSGRQAVLCGNVGTSFLGMLSRIKKKSCVVLELSSFQLEDCEKFRPKIAVVLNLSANHLDRHGNLKNYQRAKEKIFARQKSTDILILNYDNPLTRSMTKKARAQVVFFSKTPLKEGIFSREGKIIARFKGRETIFADCGRLRLKGDHNLENVLACVSAAWFLKLKPKAIEEVFENFKTLEHRVEPLGLAGGVYFVNDSKSTTPASTQAALGAVPGPLILIAGGRDKGASFEEIEPFLESCVKRVILYGEARQKIADSWKNFKRCEITEKFESAVALAWENALPGDSILLSPMCASFDQFSCFEERGERFKKIFRGLRAKSGKFK